MKAYAREANSLGISNLSGHKWITGEYKLYKNMHKAVKEVMIKHNIRHIRLEIYDNFEQDHYGEPNRVYLISKSDLGYITESLNGRKTFNFSRTRGEL